MKIKLFLIIFFFVGKGYSQDIYTFNGNGYWTDASNWVNSTIPPAVLPAGSSIYISTDPSDSCFLNTIQKINSGAFLIVTSGSNLILSGGLFTILEGTRLDKLLFTYTDNTGTDTTIFQYTYDNSGRMINAKDSIFNGTERRVENDMSCYYLGTDTLPYKFVWFSDVGVFRDSTEVFITYDKNGKRTADTAYWKRKTMFGYEGLKKINRKYEYSTGLVYGTSFDSLIYEIGSTSNPVNVRDTNWLDANGNVIRNKRYDFYTNRLLRSGDYNFDNHPNPLYHLGIARAYNIFPNDFTEFWFFPQPNNMISAKENTEYFGVWDVDYNDFEYLPNGNPKQFVRASVTSGKAMVIFVYR